MFPLKEMHALQITDDYDSFSSFTDNGDIEIIEKHLFLSIVTSVFSISFISLIIWTMIRPLINE